MARSNGHNGQAGPPVHPQEGVPHWRHPNDPVPAGVGHAGQAHAPQHAYAQPPLQGHLHPGQAHPGFAPSPDLPPFGQQPHDPYAQGQPLAHYAPYPPAQPQQAPAHQWAPQSADPQGYDLGQFGHGQPAYNPAAQQPLGHDPFPRTAPTQPANPQQWSQHQYPAPPAHQDPHLPQPQAFAEPVTGQRAPLPFPQAAPVLAAPALAGAAGALRSDVRGAPAHPPQVEEDFDEDYEEELEDEPKRGRKLMVVGALVGAICVGGGLAYAYKTFSGGKTPLINAQKAPPKAVPVAAPVQAPKVEAKLPDAVPVQAAAAAPPVDDGVRRVQSIVIPPPGGAAVAPPQPAPPPTAAVMPGMVLDNMPRVPAPAAAPPPASAPLRPSTAPAAAPPAAAPPVVKPPQAAAKEVQQKVAAATPPPAPAVPAPERKAVAVPKKTPDAFNPSAAAAAGGAAVAPAPPPATAKSALGAGGAGYVATVLSTQRGRPEAMKAFADLQQKFPDVLGGKPAEVQEKDLGAEKGVWYRAVVGPPGSREAASSVCTQLKASGYGQCFVTAY